VPKDYKVEPEAEHPVIIAGFGHFGSTLGRFLRANNVNATFLDSDSDRVAFLRKMGFNVHFGDATRLDLLEAAGAAKARVIISAMDDPGKNMLLAELVKKHFPHVKLFLRARNRMDAFDLMEKEFDNVYRESLHSSVYMAVDVFADLGQRRYTAEPQGQRFHPLQHRGTCKRLVKDKRGAMHDLHYQHPRRDRRAGTPPERGCQVYGGAGGQLVGQYCDEGVKRPFCSMRHCSRPVA
jgi:hypothetical protein